MHMELSWQDAGNFANKASISILQHIISFIKERGIILPLDSWIYL
jgi:hypothetical protein